MFFFSAFHLTITNQHTVTARQPLAWRTDVISHQRYRNILPDEGLCRLYYV